MVFEHPNHTHQRTKYIPSLVEFTIIFLNNCTLPSSTDPFQHFVLCCIYPTHRNMENNNVVGFHHHKGSLTFPSHLKLGTYATINMTTRVSCRLDDGSYVEWAEVSYTVEGSKCNLLLTRLVHSDAHFNTVTFTINDSIIWPQFKSLSLHITKTKTGLLHTLDLKADSPITWTKTRKNVDARGGAKNTKVYLYGTANRCGLLVLECEKIDYHGCAKAVTMAHYFVSSNGLAAVNRTSETTEIGFSVVVKVGICDGKFDIALEGPEQHSVSALLYMFDQVNSSGIWKPSMCPHCANIKRECSRTPANTITIDNSGNFIGHGCGAYVGGNFNVYN